MQIITTADIATAKAHYETAMNDAFAMADTCLSRYRVTKDEDFLAMGDCYLEAFRIARRGMGTCDYALTGGDSDRRKITKS